MRRTRLGLVALFGVVALAVAADPVAAQASRSAGLINELNAKLLYIAVPITLLVEFILVYTIVRFKDNDDPSPTRENRRLEITWTVATAIVLLFVGVASYGVLANENVTLQSDAPIAPDENDVLVHAEAFQWGWDVRYPQHGNVSAPMGDNGPRIVVPADQDLYVTVTSRDVIHGLHVPKLGLKQDAIPGQENTIKTVPLEPGTYQGYCTEYCGVAHSQMYFSIEVVPQEQYDAFVAERTEGASTNSSAVEGGSTPVEPAPR